MKQRPRYATRTLIVLVAIFAFAFGGGADAASWLPASDLSAPGGDGSQAQVASDSAGNLTAVWRRFDSGGSVIQTSTRSITTGEWSPARTLSQAGQDALVPDIAVDASGNAVVLWRRFDDTSYVIQAVTRTSQGTWGTIKTISDTNGNAYEPDIAIDAGGRAVAVWRRFDGANHIIQSSSRPANGEWEAPVNLSQGGADSYFPHVAVDPSGNAAAVWRRFDGSNFVVQVANRTAGQPWSGSTPLSQTGQDAFGPTISVAGNGDAVAVWRRSDGRNMVIQAASRTGSQGPWQSARSISAPGQDAVEPQIALDAAGSAIAMWVRFDGNQDVIQTSTRAAGADWGAAENLSQPGQDAARPKLAVTPAGAASAVWRRFDGANTVIQGATRSVGGAWEGLTTLSAAGRSADEPAVAIAANGVTSAVWSRSNGANTIVQSSVRSDSGPVLTAVGIPASVAVRTPAAFSASVAAGPFPLVGAPAWTFGDGASANGASVTHTYTTSGTYAVTVSQVDAGGNRVTAQRSIVVTNPGVTNRPLVKINRLSIRPPRCLKRNAKRVCVRLARSTTIAFRSDRAVRVDLLVRRLGSARVIGKLTYRARAGSNMIQFRGIVNRKPLRAGRYRLTLLAKPPARLTRKTSVTVRLGP